MSGGFTESVVEQAALAWLESAAWQVLSGAEIAPGEPAAERDGYGQVVLVQRLCDALAQLNPALPAQALAHRFRDPKDPFKLVLVRDMWLTGFDAPSLHTMYVDKPMRGHGLMQAIALAVPHAEALRIRDDVAFFQAVQGVIDIFVAAGLAKEMREAHARGDALKLSEDELAFYDALETNDSAVKVLGDETLRTIAQELVKTVRANVTIDWTLRENVRAQLRVLVKRILRKYGYPPDKQEQATQTVLEQAALLSAEWVAA